VLEMLDSRANARVKKERLRLLAEGFLWIAAPERQSDSIDGVEIGNRTPGGKGGYDERRGWQIVLGLERPRRGIASGHAQLQTIPIEIDVARAILDVRNDQQASCNCNHVLR
jgi:hypothetical protein